MMMKRGCRVFVSSTPEAAEVLRRWDPKLKVVPTDLSRALREPKALATVHGYGVGDTARIKALSGSVPAFFPLIGMTEEEIEDRLAFIRSG
jgi:thiamine biosynthesis protein ThiI